MEKDSVLLLEQVRAIDKRRLKEYIAHVSDEMMTRANKALAISVELLEI